MHLDVFTIENISQNKSEISEALGTKEKFWFHHPSLGHCLFKYTRTNTGEDWAEKIASELCQILALPHAKYEFAVCNGRRGIISPTILIDKSELVHGNEILIGKRPDYLSNSSKSNFHMTKHTLGLVLKSTSAFYDKETDRKPLTTVEAFSNAANLHPNAANIWLSRLKTISDKDLDSLFNKIPNHLISNTSIDFAQKMLYINKNRLLSL